MISLLAVVALIPDPRAALYTLLVAQVFITVFGSIAGCSVNAWMRQLLGGKGLGGLFSRRLPDITLAKASRVRSTTWQRCLASP